MNKFYPTIGLAFLSGALMIWIPAAITSKNAVPLESAGGSAVLGFIQLVALVIPALAIFADAMLTYSYRKGNSRGKSGGVGPLGPEIFRAGVWFVAGLSGVFLTMGLISLLFAIQTPPAIKNGMGLVITGISFLTLSVLVVAVLEFRDI